MSVYVDTSAILAIIDADDRWHTQAAEAWLALMESPEEVLTSNYAVVEVASLLQRRFGLKVLRRFVEEMLPAMTVVFVDPGLQERALSAVLAGRGRRGPGLVDCAAFEIIRERSVDRVFAFDSHFRERGYAMVR
ncbi:MAG: type II toxin-antitoxin system VapC family toxin [Armatimonadota bacterium]